MNILFTAPVFPRTHPLPVIASHIIKDENESQNQDLERRCHLALEPAGG